MKKIIISFCFIFFLFFSAINVKAANSTSGNVSGNIWIIQNQNFIDALKSPNQTLESWMAGKELVGIPQTGIIPLTIRTLTGYLWGLYDENGNIVTPGASGGLSLLINNFYANKPISSTTYFRSISNLTLGIKTVNASPGTNFLTPVLNLWTTIRNVSYIFFVVIIIAIGFMVMLRTKINPQTVVTIQESMPRIIISLLLVTFSYALFGFFVDLVYVFNALIDNVFNNPAVIPGFRTANSIDIIGLIFSYDPTVPGGLIFIIGQKLATGIPGLLTGNFSSLIDFIIALVLVSTIFKIFFSLLTKYVSIYLYTIFSPFAFLWGSLPGQEDTTSKIIRSFLVAVLTFPATFLLLNIALYLANDKSLTALFLPLPPFSLGSAGGGTLSATKTLQGLVGLGMLMATASVPQALEDALAVRGGAGAAAAEGLSGALRRLPLIGSFLG